MAADALSKVFAALSDPLPRDMVARLAEGDDEFGFCGSFHVVRPNEVIVQTFTYEGVPDGVALERMEFEALDGGRTRLMVTWLVGSFEERDAILASGMEHGVREGYEKLDELLAG